MPRFRDRPATPASLPALLAAVAAALLTALPAAADEMALRSVEGQRYRAMVQGDLEVLERFLDDELVYTHSHGGVDDKAAFLESLRSGAVVYQKIQLGGSDVEVWGDAAVVTGLAVLEVDADARRVTAPVRFTAVYRRGPDLRWRLLAWQTTPSGTVESRPLEDGAPEAGRAEAGEAAEAPGGDGSPDSERPPPAR